MSDPCPVKWNPLPAPGQIVYVLTSTGDVRVAHGAGDTALDVDTMAPIDPIGWLPPGVESAIAVQRRTEWLSGEVHRRMSYYHVVYVSGTAALSAIVGGVAFHFGAVPFALMVALLVTAHAAARMVRREAHACPEGGD